MKVIITVLLILIAGLHYRLWVGEGSLAEMNSLEERVAKAVTDNAVKANRNQILRAEVIELKSGLESIEERARSELGMIKEGETFYLLVGNHATASDSN
ncbi:MAG: septum formation initiator family protein [Gammaproteobacteria bacterium]|nr:septum formation initiator family protein [Gammaproteobacteria bacterium]